MTANHGPLTEPLIREKPHRLPREYYRGEVKASFTACIADHKTPFTSPEIVNACIDRLTCATHTYACICVYCFMPDHVHILMMGCDPTSDTYLAMVVFKQQTGFWFRSHQVHCRWQKGFHDHMIRAGEDMEAHALYIANNPLRKGLVTRWTDYPYTGAIGIDLNTFIGEGIRVQSIK